MAGVLILVMEFKALKDIPQMSLKTAVLLFMSCLIATLINITVVAIIGKFGAVTTAVLGHLKTTIIISLGFALHQPPMDWILLKNLTGITIALFGAVKYGQYTSFPDSDWRRCCGCAPEASNGTNGNATNGKVIPDEEVALKPVADAVDQLEDLEDSAPEADVIGNVFDSSEDIESKNELDKYAPENTDGPDA
mmetsp:Transcript_119734/g.217554  ORF Transcript_119734/g.217554 Transcript_119734/m.217554 type:complete len:193 (+) Transcript_119734:3-581(+)